MTKFSDALDQLGRARADSHALLRAIQSNVHNIEEQIQIAVELEERLLPLADELVDARLDEQAARLDESKDTSLLVSDNKSRWNCLEHVRDEIGRLVLTSETTPISEREQHWNDALNEALRVVLAEQRSLTYLITHNQGSK